MLWFCASLTNHLRLKPFIGKEPNCSGLNESTTTTTIGTNIKMYISIVYSRISDQPEIILMKLFPLKAFEYLIDAQISVIGPYDGQQQAEQYHADG